MLRVAPGVMENSRTDPLSAFSATVRPGEAIYIPLGWIFFERTCSVSAYGTCRTVYAASRARASTSLRPP